MDEHAVFWRDSSVPGAVFGGGAVVDGDRLRLRGSDGRDHVVETVPAVELAGLAPGADDEAIADFPSMRLDLHNGRSLVVAAALGVTVLAELAERLAALMPIG